MKFYINDLIQVIGKKYGLELSDDICTDLSNIDLDKVPVEFLEDIQNIVIPLVSNSEESEIEVVTKEHLYQLIPEEHFDEIKPIDEDGKKLMSLSQLREAVKYHGPEIKSFNTNENANREREKFKASYVHDDYPVYVGLEHSWRLLESDYKVVNREEHPANDPLSSFSYYVELGFYPPPEIMMVIGKAIQHYFASKGSMSLDEAFFVDKYKKTNSLAYKKHRQRQYAFFEFYLNRNKARTSNDKLSLEKIMSKAIEETDPITMKLLGFDPNVDIDTFLRGYRRWKKDSKDGKYD